MASIYKTDHYYTLEYYYQNNRRRKDFKTYHQAEEFLKANPQYGELKTRPVPTYLYFRQYKDGRERWEARFPKNIKGEYVSTFLKKEEAAAFRDLFIKKWIEDPDFSKDDLRKEFFIFKYKIENAEKKQDEIASLKMQIEVLSDVLKELESS